MSSRCLPGRLVLTAVTIRQSQLAHFNLPLTHGMKSLQENRTSLRISQKPKLFRQRSTESPPTQFARVLARTRFN